MNVNSLVSCRIRQPHLVPVESNYRVMLTDLGHSETLLSSTGGRRAPERAAQREAAFTDVQQEGHIRGPSHGYISHPPRSTEGCKILPSIAA